MFLNYIKDFFVKRILKKNFQSTRSSLGSDIIRTVGLLVDESSSLAANIIVASLISQGILKQNIDVLVYNEKQKKDKNHKLPSYSIGDLNWDGSLRSGTANEFIANEFDLLINYYELEKAALLAVSYNSKANFTVGFSTVDKQLNDLIIKTAAEDQLVFINETFKYLKILNKI
jgi:hypothetical protein